MSISSREPQVLTNPLKNPLQSGKPTYASKLLFRVAYGLGWLSYIWYIHNDQCRIDGFCLDDVTGVEDIMLIVPSKTCTVCGLLMTLILWSLNVGVRRTKNHCSDALSTLQMSKKLFPRFMDSSVQCVVYCSVFVLWPYSTLRMLVLVRFLFRVWHVSWKRGGKPRLSMP